MTLFRAKRLVALSTTRAAHWPPSRFFTMFLRDSIPDAVAEIIRLPVPAHVAVGILVDGWRLKYRASQYNLENV